MRFDETQGYRGPVTKLEPVGEWGAKLAEVKALKGWLDPWEALAQKVAELERMTY